MKNNMLLVYLVGGYFLYKYLLTNPGPVVNKPVWINGIEYQHPCFDVNGQPFEYVGMGNCPVPAYDMQGNSAHTDFIINYSA
jgi:hypothetical protein